MRKTPLRGLFIMSRGLSSSSSSSSPPKKIGIFHLVCCVHPFFLKREDMKHETRMARLGVRSTSSTHHIHLDDYTHTSYNVNFGESFLTISNLYTTFLVQHKVLLLYSSRYSAHHMMRQSSAKFTKKMFKS